MQGVKSFEALNAPMGTSFATNVHIKSSIDALLVRGRPGNPHTYFGVTWSKGRYIIDYRAMYHEKPAVVFSLFY